MNTFTRKDQGMWINEKHQLDLIYQYLDGPELVDDFCDMWINDLEAMTEAEDKEEAIRAANAILMWFNIDLRVTDVDWHYNDRCFLWKLK